MHIKSNACHTRLKGSLWFIIDCLPGTPARFTLGTIQRFRFVNAASASKAHVKAISKRECNAEWGGRIAWCCVDMLSVPCLSVPKSPNTKCSRLELPSLCHEQRSAHQLAWPPVHPGVLLMVVLSRKDIRHATQRRPTETLRRQIAGWMMFCPIVAIDANRRLPFRMEHHHEAAAGAKEHSNTGEGELQAIAVSRAVEHKLVHVK